MEEKKRVTDGAAEVNWDLELTNLNSVEAPAAFLRLRAIDKFPIDETSSPIFALCFSRQGF